MISYTMEIVQLSQNLWAIELLSSLIKERIIKKSYFVVNRNPSPPPVSSMLALYNGLVDEEIMPKVELQLREARPYHYR